METLTIQETDLKSFHNELQQIEDALSALFKKYEVNNGITIKLQEGKIFAFIDAGEFK